jgi:RepB DNA-primase from phage plasmid
MKIDKFARDIAGSYLRGAFEPTDRLAVVLVNKQAASVIQRVATAEKIAAQDFQAWLRYQNAQRYEIYVSMNALREDARGRTKEDIAVIRHVYLDFDHDGNAAVQALFKRHDLPTPSYIVNTSPGKWQVIWRVEGFAKEEAEDLQRALARETRADPAATDCARVLRLPGFYNHKYDHPYFVCVEPHAAIAGSIYSPEQFPKLQRDERAIRHQIR